MDLHRSRPQCPSSAASIINIGSKVGSNGINRRTGTDITVGPTVISPSFRAGSIRTRPGTRKKVIISTLNFANPTPTSITVDVMNRRCNSRLVHANIIREAGYDTFVVFACEVVPAVTHCVHIPFGVVG
jgi:hypothetical protein